MLIIKIECAIKDSPQGWGGYMTNNLPILAIIKNLKVNDYDYDYLSILQIQVRLLKMIMCFRFLQHKFSNQSKPRLAFKMMVNFINISFEIVYLSASRPGPPEISSASQKVLQILDETFLKIVNVAILNYVGSECN